MRFRQNLIFCFLGILITSGQSLAWGPDDHHTVGAVADSLISGYHAAA